MKLLDGLNFFWESDVFRFVDDSAIIVGISISNMKIIDILNNELPHKHALKKYRKCNAKKKNSPCISQLFILVDSITIVELITE